MGIDLHQSTVEEEGFQAIRWYKYHKVTISTWAISGEEFAIGAVQAGCEAKREERRVAGPKSDEQRCSAPVCAAKMANSFPEIALLSVLALD